MLHLLSIHIIFTHVRIYLIAVQGLFKGLDIVEIQKLASATITECYYSSSSIGRVAAAMGQQRLLAAREAGRGCVRQRRATAAATAAASTSYKRRQQERSSSRACRAAAVSAAAQRQEQLAGARVCGSRWTGIAR